MPTSTPPHAVRVSAGPANILVTSDDPAVTGWITQCLGSGHRVRTSPSTSPTTPPARSTRRSRSIRVQLEADGWAILHASATVHDNNATLALGPKGAGKTTTALLLTALGHRLLANDRVFLHPATLILLPWPAAAALGLGLLHAHGFLDGMRARLAAGQHLHPTVNPTVTAAILDGRTSPLRDPHGRELKTQLFPHQLTDWLGLQLARSATATTLIFPRIDPHGEPRLDSPPRTLTARDFFTLTTTTATPTSCG